MSRCGRALRDAGPPPYTAVDSRLCEVIWCARVTVRARGVRWQVRRVTRRRVNTRGRVSTDGAGSAVQSPSATPLPSLLGASILSCSVPISRVCDALRRRRFASSGHVPCVTELICVSHCVVHGSRTCSAAREPGRADRCNQSQARPALMAGLYLRAAFLTIRHHQRVSEADIHLTSGVHIKGNPIKGDPSLG